MDWLFAVAGILQRDVSETLEVFPRWGVLKCTINVSLIIQCTLMVILSQTKDMFTETV